MEKLSKREELTNAIGLLCGSNSFHPEDFIKLFEDLYWSYAESILKDEEPSISNSYAVDILYYIRTIISNSRDCLAR